MAQYPRGNSHLRHANDKHDDSVNLLGVTISTLPVEAVIEFIAKTITAKRKAIVAYVNVHAINLSQDLPWFREFLNKVELTYCDGFGIKWGVRLLGSEISGRYTPPDWFPHLARTCAREGFSLFFLGARPEVAERAAKQLKQREPTLKIVGTQHGYFEKIPGSPENETIIQVINQAKPDILVIGLGMPLQEKWIMENWDHIDARVALPVGAFFDYVANEKPRAPHWMTEHGFEWLGRLIVEPKRLWKRYLLGNPRFLMNVLKQRIYLQSSK